MTDPVYPPLFTKAVNRLLDPNHEGGYSPARPGDPGGETNFGISHRAYPELDIKNLTRDEAVDIYFRDFWPTAARIPGLGPCVATEILDTAVNSGPHQAIVLLQAALGVATDGVWGPNSAAALARWQGRDAILAAVFNGYRLRYLTNLDNWPANARGWARRIAANNISLGVFTPT